MDNISRNADDMQTFASQLENAITEIQSTCENFLSAINQAEPALRDNNSRNAVTKLRDVVKQIYDDIPSMDDAHKRLVKSISILKSRPKY